MNPGKLDKRGTIYTETATNAQGLISYTDTTYKADVWAAIVPLSGQELWTARQVQSKVTHKITMRYYAGVEPKMKFVYNSRTFHFVSVTNRDEANQWLDIEAVEEID